MTANISDNFVAVQYNFRKELYQYRYQGIDKFVIELCFLVGDA